MSQKKTATVNYVREGKRRWRVTVEGADLGLLSDLADGLKSAAKKHDVTLVNAADPFARVNQPEKKARQRRQTTTVGRTATDGAGHSAPVSGHSVSGGD